MKVIVIAVTLLSCTLAIAQTKPSVKQATPLEVCGNTIDPQKGMTGCQEMALRARLLNINSLMSQQASLEARIQQAGNELNAYIGRLLSASPGMTYEEPSEHFPSGRLVPAAKTTTQK